MGTGERRAGGAGKGDEGRDLNKISWWELNL